MFKTVLAACALLCALIVHAEARPRQITVPSCVERGSQMQPSCNGNDFLAGVKSISVRMHRLHSIRREPMGDQSSVVVPHPSGCPARAFCGCGAAVRIFGAPIRSLWLAANWFRFPRAAPAPGMAAVRRHHVFVLEQHLEGNVWQVFDANSGRHATQIHARSIAGYVIVNPRA